MEVGEAILAVGAGERPASFEQFSAAIDPQWIAEALAATDTASVRRRKLPAEHVMWLVIGMGLFRDRSITQVVHHLDLVVPARRGERGRVSNAAIVQARDQLGAAPLAALFTQTATVWTTEAAATERWRGLAVYGLAGTTLRVPDTPENVTTFGRPGSPDGAGAGYPQVRVVALLNLRHHLLAAAAVGLLSHRRTRAGARGVGRAPRPRGGHPGPWLLQLRPVPCPERPDPRPPLARASPRRAHRRAAPNRRARRVGRCVGGAATDQHHLRQTPRPAAHAAGARRPGPAPRLPPLLALHLAAQPPQRARRGTRRALPRALGARTRLRRTQDPHARPRRGPAQQGTGPRRTGSVGTAARLQPRPAGHEPRRPACRRAPRTLELSPRAVDRHLLAIEVSHFIKSALDVSRRRGSSSHSSRSPKTSSPTTPLADPI